MHNFNRSLSQEDSYDEISHSWFTDRGGAPGAVIARYAVRRCMLKLSAGDEIYFGEAYAQFELADSLATKHLSKVE